MAAYGDDKVRGRGGMRRLGDVGSDVLIQDALLPVLGRAEDFEVFYSDFFPLATINMLGGPENVAKMLGDQIALRPDGPYSGKLAALKGCIERDYLKGGD